MPKLETKELPKKKVGGRSSAAKDDSDDSSITGVGWDPVANKKAISDELANAPKKSEFRLKDGENAHVQFLDDQPYALNVHQMKIDGYWKTIPCQLATQRHCTMCDDGLRQGWKAAFRILDFRGEWDKDKKAFKHNTPVEKLWMVNQAVANQIKKQYEKKGTLLNSVFDVSRTGAGKSDTSYNLETALDDDDMKVKPKKHTLTLPEPKDLLVPPTDRVLLSMGYSKSKIKGNKEDDAELD